MSPRVRILLAAVGILAVVVIGDSVLKARADASDPASPRARYLEQAKIVAAKRDLAARAAQWSAALEQAKAQWAEVRPMLIEAQTADLAVASFRDDIRAAAENAGITVEQIVAAKAEPIAAAPGLHKLEIRLEVESHDVPGILRLVDRLENLPHRLTGITEVRLDGPGINTAAADLRATVVVQSLGLVAGGAS